MNRNKNKNFEKDSQRTPVTTSSLVMMLDQGYDIRMKTEQRKRQSSETDLCSISKLFSTQALWILHGKG